MLFLKKLVFTGLLVGSTLLFAGSMGPVCTRGTVTIACDHAAWNFGLRALYLKPGFNGLDYVGVHTNTNGVTQAIDFNPAWGWGFEMDAAYQFSSGNDLAVNWYHYSQGTRRAFYLDSFDLTSPFPLELRAGSVLQPTWDAANVELGQQLYFSELKTLRFYAGAQYAQFKAASTIQTATPDEFRRFSAHYKGIGPRIGIDARYGFANGLGVYANSATALLLGRSSFEHVLRGSAFVPRSVVVGSKMVMVPELEGKLGANYTYALAQGDFVLDAGWMWNNYFNPFNIVTLLSKSASLSTQSNFSITGPYLALKWISDV